MQEQFPECALIVSSGYSEDEVMANYRRFGFSQILKKPYASDELLAVIQRARVLREC